MPRLSGAVRENRIYTFPEKSPTAPEAHDMDEEFISKTRAKKEDRALRLLGEQLVGLPPEKLDKMEIPDELREAVRLAAETTAHGARNRQIKYIGGLLRYVDLGPIRAILAGIARGDTEKALAFKKIERWRDALKQGDLSLVDEIMASCPVADRQRLTQLARNAKREFEAGKGAVAASRQLFRYLKEVSA